MLVLVSPGALEEALANTTRQIYFLMLSICSDLKQNYARKNLSKIKKLYFQKCSVKVQKTDLSCSMISFLILATQLVNINL